MFGRRKYSCLKLGLHVGFSEEQESLMQNFENEALHALVNSEADVAEADLELGSLKVGTCMRDGVTEHFLVMHVVLKHNSSFSPCGSTCI